MSGALLALLLTQAAIHVTGDSTCPTAAEVNDKLVAMVPDAVASAGAPALHAYLSSTSQAVYLELLDEKGAPMAERTLARSGTCSDVAEAVAVVLGTWQAKLNPGVGATVARLSSSSHAADMVMARPTSDGDASAVRFDAGLGLLASVINREVAPGARIDGSLFPGRLALGLWAALSATATHTQSIDQPASEAQWVRAALSLGPTLRIGHARPGLDLHAGAVAAVLHIKGARLPQTASDTSVQLGLTAGLHGLWAWHNAAGWVGTDLFVFPGNDGLTIGNYGTVGRLARLELQLGFGVALGQFR